MTSLGDGENRLPALLGYYRYLNLTFLNVIHCIRRVPLRIDYLPVTEILNEALEFPQESLWRERPSPTSLPCHNYPLRWHVGPPGADA